MRLVEPFSSIDCRRRLPFRNGRVWTFTNMYVIGTPALPYQWQIAKEWLSCVSFHYDFDYDGGTENKAYSTLRFDCDSSPEYKFIVIAAGPHKLITRLPYLHPAGPQATLRAHTRLISIYDHYANQGCMSPLLWKWTIGIKQWPLDEVEFANCWSSTAD